MIVLKLTYFVNCSVGFLFPYRSLKKLNKRATKKILKISDLNKDKTHRPRIDGNTSVTFISKYETFFLFLELNNVQIRVVADVHIFSFV